jgi:UDP-2,3-diacylglucosamine pyrophosphatase LpxH
MSRALNVDATIAEVIEFSAGHNAPISAIESLHPKGTRVVFVNGNDAATVARAYGAKVMTGPVSRKPWTQQVLT